MPRIAPYPWRIVQTPTHMFFLFEGNIHSYRQIFMDGRKHPADPDPTWYGHSIGRWEGTRWSSTPSASTTSSGSTSRAPAYRAAAHPRALHAEGLQYARQSVTIDDPGAYSKPFTVTFTARLRPGDELLEYICNENNQDVEHIHGPTQPGGDPERPLGTLKTR